MTTTFRRHFDEDIMRVESLLALANGAAPAIRKGNRADDIRLAAVAMAVGAMDAYFCDAYVDCLAKRLQSFKSGVLDLPESYGRRNLPTAALLSPPQNLRPNWSLRMAARNVMERENVLDLDRVTELFNPILPKGERLWSNVMDRIIDRDWRRLTGISKKDYRALPGRDQLNARKTAVGVMKGRVGETIQFRHDWIHNCGRPKIAIQRLTSGQAKARVREVRAVIEGVDEHLMTHRVV
jgi:hypothetical protein